MHVLEFIARMNRYLIKFGESKVFFKKDILRHKIQLCDFMIFCKFEPPLLNIIFHTI